MYCVLLLKKREGKGKHQTKIKEMNGIIPIMSKKFTVTDFLIRDGRRKLASSYGIASGKKIDICAHTETIDG